MLSKLKNLIKAIFKVKPFTVLKPNVLIGISSTVANSDFGQFIKIGRNSYLHNSIIGSYSYLSGYNCLMNVKVGKYCSIAERVSIGAGMHPTSTFVSTSPVFFSINKQCGTSFSDQSYFKETGTVVIGNDVWIGTNAVILDNVIIGDGAIIAANAVVNKNVEPYSIVGGVPAKVIRKRFTEEEIEFLIDFKWWNKDPDWLKVNFKKFHDIREFIESVKVAVKD
jgi:acetyltransferase-like isoleucine patch superfamily enzyme